MKISGNTYQPGLYRPNNSRITSTRPEEQSPSHFTKEDPKVWKQLARQYDITHASFAEVKTVARKLYDAKQISFSDFAALTFNPQEGPQWKSMTKGIKNPRWWLTEADSSGKRNWVAEWEARAEQQRKLGNPSGAKKDEYLAQILRGLLK